MNKLQGLEAELAELWLCWPERRLAQCDSTKPMFGWDGSWQQPFIDYLNDIFGPARPDFLAHVVEAFFSKRANLVELYEAVLTKNRVSVQSTTRVATIKGEEGYFERWMRLICYIDPDALATLCLAQPRLANVSDQHPSAQVCNWGMSPRADDAGLGLIYNEGMTDLHIHASGMRVVPYLWLQYAVGDPEHRALDLDEFKHFKDAKLLQTFAEKYVVESAKAVLSNLNPSGSELRTCRTHADRFFHYEPNSDFVPLSPNKVLFCERMMLLRAWSRLRADPELRKKSSRQLANELDIYLSGKQLFRAQHLHPLGSSTPGLRQFVKYFAKTKSGVYRSKQQREKEGLNIAWLWHSGDLKKAEIRIAPAEKKRSEYWRYLKELRRILNDLKALDKTPPYASARERTDPFKLSVAVHIQRSLPIVPSSADVHDLLQKTDKETAMLHEFRIEAHRQGPRGRELLSFLSRIDIAAEERGAPSNLFFPHFKLLRQDPDALQELATRDVHAPYYQNWLDLEEQNKAQYGGGLEQLGITVHTGEDFFSPLDGLWQIADTLYGLELTDGDAIGHGLALGTDFRRFLEQENRLRHIPRGIEIDSLLWLYAYARDNGCDVSFNEMTSLENFLRRNLADIYDLQKPIDLDEAHGKLNCAGNLLLAVEEPLTVGSASWFRRADFLDSRVVDRRSAVQDISEIQYQVVETFERVQQALVRDVADKGVMIETNPSSNWRIAEGVDSVRELPIRKVLSAADWKLKVTVCTDDPGVFDTQIESEYALLFESLKEELRPHRLEILEKMRHVGMQFDMSGYSVDPN